MACLLSVGGSFAAEYYVAKQGNDANNGSVSKPLLTIQQAATVAMPGDVVTIHEGIYREAVNPPRGGLSDEQRIVYQAATGASVTIKGSQILKGWTLVSNDVWSICIPNNAFRGN
jgi:hypothetical protein